MANGERIIGWGELLWDCLPSGRRLGGAPANVAYHAACLGADASLVSRVGDDALGEEALVALGERGVATELVQRDVQRPTGTVRVTFIDGEPQYEIEADVAWDQIELRPELTAALGQLDLFCFGTLAQRTPGARATLNAALAELPRDCLRLCDLNLRPGPGNEPEIIAAALDAANVVKLNQAEIDTLSELFGVADVPTWLMAQRGATLVAITRGADGSRLIDRHGSWEHPGLPLESATGDPVGAGDAFCAALAVGLVRNLPLAQINTAANRYAAFVASRLGAMPAIPEELRGALGSPP